MSESTASRLDDYIDVFVAPSKLFERRSDGKYGQALLVLILASALLFFGTRTAMAPIWDAEMERSMASSTQSMTPEQIEAGKKFGGVFLAVSVIVGLPIGVLLFGLCIMIVARAIGTPVRYAQGATIATFMWFPRLVGSAVAAVQALLMDESSLTSQYAVSLGIGRFLDPVTASPYLMALVGRLDVFTLWVTALIAIGLQVIAKATLGQAIAGAVILWFVGALPAVLQAMMA